MSLSYLLLFLEALSTNILLSPRMLSVDQPSYKDFGKIAGWPGYVLDTLQYACIWLSSILDLY